MALSLVNEESLLKLYNEDPTTLLFARLAALLLGNGKRTKATTIAETGVQQYPDYVTGRIVLAQCYSEADNYTGAYTHITEVLKKEPQNAKALALLSEISEKMGNMEEAEKVRGCLRQIYPHDPTLEGKKIVSQQ
ncbi:tetratricopeptide repeat protein [Chitinivibrio alkaliphilus]|uniref:Uncharacterized protein n=1 Tax=Chitinivibrio alkaliphilus ACht1 TaxID=1313304 RepID=U7DCD8_9BACT|nr:tetratricopeptide repeat protein [Chitinivibrio alkaliphilus]ERP32090.1 hypothetical protein CALK_0810 [Chitinivibrio alkaliphilus ACht1]